MWRTTLEIGAAQLRSVTEIAPKSPFYVNRSPIRYAFHVWGYVHSLKYRGTQREILRKRPKNNNKAWIKLSEAILSILGDCWEKFICSSLPARLMEDDAILDIKSIPSDTLNWLFPSNTFPPRTYYFSQISQPERICLNNRYFEEQIHWVPLKIDSFSYRHEELSFTVWTTPTQNCNKSF